MLLNGAYSLIFVCQHKTTFTEFQIRLKRLRAVHLHVFMIYPCLHAELFLGKNTKNCPQCVYQCQCVNQAWRPWILNH